MLQSRMTRFLSFFLLSTVCLAQTAPKIHTSRTDARMLPLPKGDDVFHFIIFGDRTGGPAEGIQVLAEAVEDTNLLDPDLVMTVGDLIQGYSPTLPWMMQMKEFHGIMNRLHAPWYPVAGNHDIYFRAPKGMKVPPEEHEERYEEHFGPLWYWFKHKNCGFLVLFTDEGHPQKNRPRNFNDPAQQKFSEEQLTWLKKAVQDMRELDHVFVFLHHPRWQKSRYPGSDWDRVHAELKKPGNVRAAFAGHIHQTTYNGVRDGIAYYSLATTGGGIPGGNIVPEFGYLHHYNVVTVRKTGFHMTVIPVGAVMDPKDYDADLQRDVAALRKLTFTHDGLPLKLASNGNATGKISQKLRNPTGQPIEIELISRNEGGWQFAPDHQHVKIKPGKTADIEFAVTRSAESLAGYQSPRMELRLDALMPGGRVSLPARMVMLEAELELSEAERGRTSANRVLATRQGSCVRVSPLDAAMPQGPMTLEGWFYVSRAGKTEVLVAKTEASEYNLELAQGRPLFNIHLNGSYAQAKAETQMPVNQWVHLAGVYDGKSVRLYVQGKLATAKPATGKRTTNSLPLYLGADTDGRGNATRFFTGKMDEVRLSQIARYQDAFTPARQLISDADTKFLFHFDRFFGPFVPEAGGKSGIKIGNPKLVE